MALLVLSRPKFALSTSESQGVCQTHEKVSFFHNLNWLFLSFGVWFVHEMSILFFKVGFCNVSLGKQDTEDIL